jgi:hypothetical protein
MKTLNQLSARAYDMEGSPNDNGVTQANNVQDIIQAMALFKNAARRYWTRRQITASLVASQQDYQLPADFVRATEITLTANGIVYPLEQMQSEHKWNQLNIIPSVTLYIPTTYFIKGNNVLSLWPAPTTTTAGTLNVSYEPRIPDFSLPDVTGTATVSNASTTVLDSATGFSQSMLNAYFSVTDGSDGNWYQIGAFDSSSSLELANYYQGISGSGRPYIIGACWDVPEDYHMALVYYACYNFYLKRKDASLSAEFLGMFQQLLDLYKETYSSKTTGVVQTRQRGAAYSVFGLPPFNIH